MEKMIHRKDRIVTSTIAVLDRVGFQNLSIKLIAQEEGVSEGALFRHFKNKDEILVAVIDHFVQYDDALIKSCYQREISALDSIRCFYKTFSTYFKNYPELTVIIQIRGALMYEPILKKKIITSTEMRNKFLKAMIDQAKIEKTIESEIASSLIVEIITAELRETYLNWRMANYQFSIEERIKERLEVLISLFLKK